MSDTSGHNTGQKALNDALRVSFVLLRSMMLLLLVVYLFSGVFVLKQHERAFVLVLGKVVGSTDTKLLKPGLHWTFPAPIGEIQKIEAERVQTIESDSFWYYIDEARRAQGIPDHIPDQLDPREDGYTLSADANLLHSKWTLRYTVSDPEAFIFDYKDPNRVLKNELDHAVLASSCRFTIDQTLRTDIEAFRSEVDRRLKQRCRDLGLGVKVQRVDLTSVIPPRQVQEAFDAVVAAEQERSSKILGARGYASRVGNESAGESKRLLSEARAYKEQLVSEVSASADYFTEIYDKYKRRPWITANTLLQDTVRRAMKTVDDKYMVQDDPDGKQEIRILLSPPQDRSVLRGVKK